MRKGLLPLLLTLAAAGCSSDMAVQPIPRAEDGPRTEPEKSVPLGAGPAVVDRDESADTLTDPTRDDEASQKHGAFLFSERCLCCHGPQGKGDGPVSKFFPPAPDLAYQSIVKRSDGYLFATLTLGGRAMPPQAEGLSVKDRWDLVHFVRAIQRSRPQPAATPAGGNP